MVAVVNWDPVDQTVLADEQVDTNGCSWRSGAKVEKKLLKQWYIKTTKFAKQLYDGLNDDTLMEWKDIINLQKHWIGECEGITVTFSLKCKENILLDSLNIWASEPEKFVHGQFITISHQHILAQDILMRNCETSTSHVVAHNPITDTELPVYVTDAADYPEGRDVYIASPKTCPKDVVLAVELNLPVCTQTVEVDLSEKLTVAEIAQQKNVGGYPVSSKLRDWLISRQRYWGTPIPIIHCNCCGVVPVPYDDLPVMLPEAASIAANGSPLAEVASRPDCTCPGCGSPAKRETDTMDTFVDSSWYFLRYLDPLNSNAPFDPDKVKGSTPVDLYIGGKEHAVLHLYYARFMTHFLHSLGWTSSPEPFKSLLVQGMIMGKSYKVKSTGKYLPPDKVEFVDDRPIEKGSGYVVETQWEKMSKSKYNGESPQNLLSLYGCDTTRLFMLADVPPAAHRHWSDATFPGILNWQHRLWLTVRELLEHRNNEHLCELTTEEFKKHEDKLWEARNYFTSATTYNYKYTHQLSVAISRMQGLTNSLRRTPEAVVAKSGEYELALSALIIMLAPIAPHFCCELWAGLVSAPHRVHDGDAPINWEGTVFEQSWPRIDDSFNLSFLCKVDGADRCNLKILPKDLDVLSHQKALQVMLGEKSIAKRVKKGIARTEFEKYPGCRAILNIFTKQVQKETKDKIQAANEQQ